LRAAEARLLSTEAALQAARSRVQRYSPIAAIGAISRDLWEETQLAVEQQEADRAVQTQNIEQQTQVVEAAKARLAKARTALDPSSTEVAIARQQIARQQATGEATAAALKRERESLIEQRIEIQKQRDRDRRELQQIEADLRQTVILAPTDGTILKLQLRNSSQIVQPGEEIAQISPQNAPIAIEALVAAADIRRVEVGQTAQIRISACPYPDYGTLAGTVKVISPDIFPNNDSPATFYKVTLQPQDTIFGQRGARCTLQAGMEGRADILSKKETVLRLLLRQARLVADF
ncbi:MAG: HlyD family efflux transporter periplasmic adaptor subunit, partial [Cyanobacteriota bacterium]|nr:HlyD family efflux transporter periplasmic adaptor subunit [Cyanobacteriota bacterium]